MWCCSGPTATSPTCRTTCGGKRRWGASTVPPRDRAPSPALSPSADSSGTGSHDEGLDRAGPARLTLDGPQAERGVHDGNEQARAAGVRDTALPPGPGIAPDRGLPRVGGGIRREAQARVQGPVTAMAYQFATYQKQGRIAIVTINRPERMNALHPPANLELDEIWNDFEGDPEVWVGILTGAGDRAFSAGNDLRFTAEHGRDMVRMGDGGFGGLANRTTCWKPILAAVNGYALGGGFEMALACDIIVAADSARLGLPEPRVGLMAGAGGVHRLPRMIPQKIAMGYILTGRHMTAQEAHRLGVVNEVVPRA